MSLLGKIFGTGKDKNKAPSPQEAIQRLRDVEEMLMKKSAFCEKKIEAEIAIAKKNGVKNKRGEWWEKMCEHCWEQVSTAVRDVEVETRYHTSSLNVLVMY